VQRLHTEFAHAIRLTDVNTQMERFGLMPVAAGPDRFAAMLKGDVEQLQRIVKTAGIQPE
jgi:tripartite-type tricarboxylate transporter receptor subunit TctC